ncbi:putative methyltransferase [Bacillus thuringiensis]|nr:putative methyltransferase [Bacillus thuringiensis]
MKRDPLFLTLLDSVNTNFSGWDFSFISETGRMKSEPLSWSYGSTAFQLMQHTESMLDMGTAAESFYLCYNRSRQLFMLLRSKRANCSKEIRAFRGYCCRGD